MTKEIISRTRILIDIIGNNVEKSKQIVCMTMKIFSTLLCNVRAVFFHLINNNLRSKIVIIKNWWNLDKNTKTMSVEINADKRFIKIHIVRFNSLHVNFSQARC